MNDHTRVVYEFAGFRLDPVARILVRSGEPVALAPKEFDTLLFLLENRGRVLEKDEFMSALWPDTFVEESNLAQHIFVLRRILGDDQNGNSFIQTVPRRGYKFIVPVTQFEISSGAPGSGQSFVLAEYWRRHSPFRGLRAFEPDDAWLFFGREADTFDLV